MKKLVSYDIEVADELLPGPLGDFTPRISCAGFAIDDGDGTPPEVTFFSSPENEEGMTNEQVDGMAAYMLQLAEAGYTFLTWNGVAFDFPLTAKWASNLYGQALHQTAFHNHIDMMLLVTFQTGYRLGLDAALTGAGLMGKLHEVTLTTGEILTDMSGAKAPALWKAGERAAVLAYLEVDVLRPLELARVIEQTHCISWRSKAGKPMSKSAPLLTVQEAYEQLPDPGYVGWMTEPIFRDPYIRQYLPGVLS